MKLPEILGTAWVVVGLLLLISVPIIMAVIDTDGPPLMRIISPLFFLSLAIMLVYVYFESRKEDKEEVKRA